MSCHLLSEWKLTFFVHQWAIWAVNIWMLFPRLLHIKLSTSCLNIGLCKTMNWISKCRMQREKLNALSCEGINLIFMLGTELPHWTSYWGLTAGCKVVKTSPHPLVHTSPRPLLTVTVTAVTDRREWEWIVLWGEGGVGTSSQLCNVTCPVCPGPWLVNTGHVTPILASHWSSVSWTSGAGAN